MWALVNTRVARFARREMNNNYFCVKYENLCADPRETVTSIFSFLSAPISNLPRAIEMVQPADSIGRWRFSADSSLFAETDTRVANALRDFGYE
jgi:hypothetical protein